AHPSARQVVRVALHPHEQGRQAPHAQRPQGFLEAQLLAEVVGRGGNGRGRRPVPGGVEGAGKAAPGGGVMGCVKGIVHRALVALRPEKDRNRTLVNLFHGVACLLQRRRQLRQRSRVGDQQLEALGRGGRAKGRENVVQRVRIGGRRRVALIRDTRGK